MDNEKRENNNQTTLPNNEKETIKSNISSNNNNSNYEKREYTLNTKDSASIPGNEVDHNQPNK